MWFCPCQETVYVFSVSEEHNQGYGSHRDGVSGLGKEDT